MRLTNLVWIGLNDPTGIGENSREDGFEPGDSILGSHEPTETKSLVLLVFAYSDNFYSCFC
jgi:hypothetical protein